MKRLENKGDHGREFCECDTSVSRDTDNQKRGNQRNVRNVFAEPDNINDNDLLTVDTQQTAKFHKTLSIQSMLTSNELTNAEARMQVTWRTLFFCMFLKYVN